MKKFLLVLLILLVVVCPLVGQLKFLEQSKFIDSFPTMLDGKPAIKLLLPTGEIQNLILIPNPQYSCTCLAGNSLDQNLLEINNGEDNVIATFESSDNINGFYSYINGECEIDYYYQYCVETVKGRASDLVNVKIKNKSGNLVLDRLNPITNQWENMPLLSGSSTIVFNLKSTTCGYFDRLSLRFYRYNEQRGEFDTGTILASVFLTSCR